MQHVPMCVMCGENEVGTFQPHNEFCGDMCADRAYDALEVDKFYEGWTEDEADYQTPVQPSGDEMYQTRYVNVTDWEAVQQEDAVSHTWEYEDHMAQWDNDPSPYDGTYSEE